ncbi:MAG: hypothetical protein ACYSWX_02825 [Planctomycetota bacterium]|jgi:hypothetical protein
MDPVTAFFLLALVAAISILALRSVEPSEVSTTTPNRPEAAPHPALSPPPIGGRWPEPTPEQTRSDRARLSAADEEPWLEIRATAWRCRRRWFAEPDYRVRLLRRLAPHGSAPATAPTGKPLCVHRWLRFLADMLDTVDDPELRSRALALYAPWRGFVLDVVRFVGLERSRLTETERAQLPPPEWLEALERLDQRLFVDRTYDFLANPLDRSLLELDGARKRQPEPRSEE